MNRPGNTSRGCGSFLYYLFLAVYAWAGLGNSLTAVMGRFRNLFYYPLFFFSGLIFTSRASDMERYLWFIRIHVLIAVAAGALSLYFPGLQLSKIYAGGEVVEAQYFMLVNHGTALLCCLVFTHDLIALATRRRRILFHVFFMTITLAGIAGCQNRSVLACFLLMTAAVVFLGLRAEKPVRRWMWASLSLTVVLVAVLVVSLLLSPFYSNFKGRVAETVRTFSGEQEFFTTNTGIRAGRTVAAFHEWLKSPVIGCGWGDQISVYHIYDFEGNYVRTNFGTPRNYFMTLLYQTGIIGFLLMMSLFYYIFRRLQPRDKLSRHNTIGYTFLLFYAVFLVFNVANTLLDGHPVSVPIFFFLTGAAVSGRALTGKASQPAQ